MTVDAAISNDLFDSEHFPMRLDGAPAATAAIEVVPGGNRYRGKLDDVRVATGPDGGFAATWPTPGMDRISAAVQDSRATIPNARRRAACDATPEVLPP
ncbi:MAG: hypothetical protein PGN34_19320 [Methylobacterium frigidaeris]